MPDLNDLFPKGDITVLDSFTRADGAVYAGAGSTLWDTIRRDGSASDLVVIDNTLGTGGTGEQGGATTETVTDFIRIVTIGTAGETGFYFGFRLANLGATHDGYLWTVLGGTATLWSITDGAFTSLGSGSMPGVSAGYQVAFRSVGNVHEIWVNATGLPVWPSAAQVSVTDPGSTYTTGKVTLEAGGDGWTFDDYASATETIPVAAVTLIVDPDHPDASNSHNRTQASSSSTPLMSVEIACLLARATDTWADTIFVARSVTSDLGDVHDPNIYPELNHRLTNSDVTWPFADNSGNETITIAGDTTDSTGDFDNLPKMLPFSYRHLKNWTIEDVQFGYDVSSEEDRLGGTGWDYLTWAIGEKLEDITYQRCLFTGGGVIVGNWAGDFTVHQCRIHAPLSPSQFGVFDGEGFGFSGQASDGTTDLSHGGLIFSECEFLEIRGNDAIRTDGCFADGVTWDGNFDLNVTDCTFRNVTEQNLVYHTDAIQIISVPRATVQRCTFIGCTDALMMVDGHHGTIRFENNLIAGPLSPTPLQVGGCDELIVRHCFFDVKETTPQDSSMGFIDRFILPVQTVFTCVNNIFGGFYFRDTQLEDYFDATSVIENNLILSEPGLVTPFGSNLAGLPEFGESARLSVIPNEVVTIPLGQVDGTIPRYWELANSPSDSPGIGEGQATDIVTDLLGRAYASPPDVGCFQSDPGTVVTPTARGPYVFNQSPVPNAVDVAVDANVSVQLYPVPGNEIDLTTVTSSNFYVTDPAGNVIPAVVSLGALVGGYQTVTVNLKLDLDPLAEGDLLPFVVYTAHLTNAIADEDGSNVDSDSWTFRTISPNIPGITGPGVVQVAPLTSIAMSARTVNEATLTLNGTSIRMTSGHVKQLQKALATHAATTTNVKDFNQPAATVTIGPLT